MFGRSPESKTNHPEHPSHKSNFTPKGTTPSTKLRRPGSNRSLPHPGTNERKEIKILDDGRRATIVHNSDGTKSGAIIYPDGSIEDIIDEMLDNDS